MYSIFHKKFCKAKIKFVIFDDDGKVDVDANLDTNDVLPIPKFPGSLFFVKYIG